MNNSSKGFKLEAMEEKMQKWEYCSLRMTYEQLGVGKQPKDEFVIGIEFCDEERPDYLEIYQGSGYAQDSMNKAIANLGGMRWELISSLFDRNGLLTEQVHWFKRSHAE